MPTGAFCAHAALAIVTALPHCHQRRSTKLLSFAEIAAGCQRNYVMPPGARRDLHDRRRQFAIWVGRFLCFRQVEQQIAPTSGSMGVGLPAAIGAARVFPKRTVVCFAGDGDFLMNGQEVATAVAVAEGAFFAGPWFLGGRTPRRRLQGERHDLPGCRPGVRTRAVLLRPGSGVVALSCSASGIKIRRRARQVAYRECNTLDLCSTTLSLIRVCSPSKPAGRIGVAGELKVATILGDAASSWTSSGYRRR